MEVGERDADDPNEDHDQRDLWLKVRSIPFERLYLSLRYRYRTRDYSIDDPAASNFKREDDRRDWTLAADLRLLDWLGLNAYVSYEDADSTKPSRVYETTLTGVGLNAYVSYEDADSTKPSRVYETTLTGVGLTFGW